MAREVRPRCFATHTLKLAAFQETKIGSPGRTVRRGKFCSPIPGFDCASLRRPLREGEIKQTKDVLSVLSTAPFLADFTMRRHRNRFCHCLEHRWRQTMVVSSTTHLFFTLSIMQHETAHRSSTAENNKQYLSKPRQNASKKKCARY
jgi:hypothetical protein